MLKCKCVFCQLFRTNKVRTRNMIDESYWILIVKLSIKVIHRDITMELYRHKKRNKRFLDRCKRGRKKNKLQAYKRDEVNYARLLYQSLSTVINRLDCDFAVLWYYFYELTS